MTRTFSPAASNSSATTAPVCPVAPIMAIMVVSYLLRFSTSKILIRNRCIRLHDRYIVVEKSLRSEDLSALCHWNFDVVILCKIYGFWISGVGVAGDSDAGIVG